MRSSVALIGMGLLFLPACEPVQPPPPVPHILSTSAPGMHMIGLQWQKGLSVVFVDDLGPGRSNRTSTTRPVFTQIGAAGRSEEEGYRWQVESRDGKTAHCKINDKEYDLANDTVFVIKKRGNAVDVHQLRRDLNIWFHQGPIMTDAEIRKLLELGEAPK